MSEIWAYSGWKVLHNFGEELHHSHIWLNADVLFQQLIAKMVVFQFFQ